VDDGEHLINLRDELREVDDDRVLDDLWVDSVVLMRGEVAHVSHDFPEHLGVLRLDLEGNLAHVLGRDLDELRYSSHRDRIVGPSLTETRASVDRRLRVLLRSGEMPTNSIGIHTTSRHRARCSPEAQDRWSARRRDRLCGRGGY